MGSSPSSKWLVIQRANNLNQMIKAKSRLFTDKNGHPLERDFTPLVWNKLGTTIIDGHKYDKQGWELISEVKKERFTPVEALEVKPEVKLQVPENTNTDEMSMVEIKKYIAAHKLKVNLKQPLPAIREEIKKLANG